MTLKQPKARSTVAGESLGIVVQGVDDVLLRLAKCCTPVPGDGSRATSRWAAASRSTAPTART